MTEENFDRLMDRIAIGLILIAWSVAMFIWGRADGMAEILIENYQQAPAKTGLEKCSKCATAFRGT